MNKNNWQVKILKQVYAPLGNLSYSREFLTETPQRLKYIHYGDIHTNEIPEMISGQTYLPFLFDSTSISNEKKYLLQTGDLIITDASEDYEGVGKSVEVATISNEKIVAGLHTIALRPIDSSQLIPGFGRYLLKHPFVSKRLKAISQGTKVFSISFSLIQKLEIHLPPVEEQRKIVEVLETWDKAIGLTKRLIEQKELQKKYLMQQLLTGHARFKEFINEWKVYSVNDFGQVITGNTPSKSCREYYGGTFPWATAEDFENKIIMATKQHLTESGKKVARCLPKGSVLITCIASIGLNAIAGVEMATNQQINALVPKRTFNTSFLFYLFTHYASYLKKFASQGGLTILPKNVFLKIKFRVPGLKEQQTIANLLSSCDKEIELLKQKLAKLEEQKKGLMRILLTGKVRLKI